MEVSCIKWNSEVMCVNKKLYRALSTWPKGYISSGDLAVLFGKTDAARYGMVNRALKEGSLLRLHRGLYLISVPRKGSSVNSYELAQVIYGPSFISFESALRYHNLIPEAVYSITSVTIKKSREIKTPLGIFSYKKVPIKSFLLGVERVENSEGIFFMASPWRAIADVINSYHKEWKSLKDLRGDLRIEQLDLFKKQKKILFDLIQEYPNVRTQSLLKRLAEELDEF